MLAEAEKILALVAERAQLAESVEGVRSILLYMYRFPSLKNKKLSQKTGIAIPTLSAVRNELVKSSIIEKNNLLGEKGRQWIKSNLNLNFEYDPLPGNFDNTIRELPEEFYYLNDIGSLLEKRPPPEFALDQSHADFSTVLKKTLYLLKKGDIEGRKIIFLGDDDLISLAIGLTKLAKEITVVDIDQRILDFISKSVKELSISNFNTLLYDIRKPCPNNIINKYDVVIMDPPYTNEGLRLFLKRARQILKSNININGKDYLIIGKKCLLSFGNKPPEEMLKLQLSILDHGFIINEMLPDFNHYEGASIIGKFSHLYYLQSVINPNANYNLSFSKHPIYTSEVKALIAYPFRPVGYHFVGELHFKKQDQLKENDKIQEVFLNSLINADLTILDVFHHHYKPYGFSAVAVLETSHAAIHTWPEHGYISVDIFICEEFSKGLEVVKFLRTYFKPEKFEFLYTERGKDPLIKYERLDLKNHK